MEGTETDSIPFVATQDWFRERCEPERLTTPSGRVWELLGSFDQLREALMGLGGPDFARSHETKYQGYMTEKRPAESRRFTAVLRDKAPDRIGIRQVHAVVAVSLRACRQLETSLTDDMSPRDRYVPDFETLRERFGLDPGFESTMARYRLGDPVRRSPAWSVRVNDWGVWVFVLGNPNIRVRGLVPWDRAGGDGETAFAGAFDPPLGVEEEVRVAAVLRQAVRGVDEPPRDLVALLDLANAPAKAGRETVAALVERRMKELRLSRRDVLDRLPFRNRSKAAQRFDQWRRGAGNLPHLTEAMAEMLNCPPATLVEAARISRAHAHAAELNVDPAFASHHRATFKPHFTWRTERSRPTSVAMAAHAGGAIKRGGDLPTDLAPEQWSRHALEKMPVSVLFFGAVIGFAIHETPDRTIEYDRTGAIVQARDRAFDELDDI